MIFRKATQEDLDYVRENPFEGVVRNYPYMGVPDDNTYALSPTASSFAIAALKFAIFCADLPSTLSAFAPLNDSNSPDIIISFYKEEHRSYLGNISPACFPM